MSAGGSVSSNNQNQSQNSVSSGNNSFTTQGNSSSVPLVTPTYNSANANATALAGAGGLTPGQQTAADYTQGELLNQPVNWMLDSTNKQAQGVVDALSGGLPQVGTSSVGTSGVSAPTAASQMSPYENTYANDVLSPSLAAFDQSVSQNDNAARAARDAGSAFGDRAAVADSVRNAQNATARGALAGQITGTGYQTALGAGQGDASNSLSASNANAGYGLQASQANASNTLAASQANAANTLASQQGILSALGLQSNNLNSISANGLNNATALYGMSGGGLSNLLSLMGAQTPAFGSENSSTGSGTGTTASNSFGTGTASGGGSSKGASVPIF